ncbi:MAG: extracellular solute-binding protein [Clostridia bacterium]|nr:extracellular solute-binding protein [Clostridia bacterium]
MKKILAVLIAITLLFTGLAVSRGKDSIVICSSAEQFRNDDMAAQLKKEFPDKDIIVMYMPTGKAAAKIFSEGEDTEIDIVVGLETGYMNKIADYLDDISGITELEYLDDLKPETVDNKWLVWEKQAGAIVYNQSVLSKNKLSKPESYEDLLKPEYQGLVAMPDPKSSGTGYFFYKNWVNEWGEDGALEYVDKLHGNLKQFTESGSGPIKLLRQGEIAVGLALTFQAVNESNSGQPLKWVFPEEGSPYSLTGTSIIKGRRKNKDVEEVFSYIANQALVHDKEEYSPEEIYKGQKNNIPNYPKGIKYANMSGIQDDKIKERLLKIWKY